MSDKIDLSKAEVLPNLPDYFRPHEGDPLPSGLVGATIVRVGTLAEPQAAKGGGLVIDYRRPQESDIRRIVLCFNELGMWVGYDGECAPTV